MINCKCGNEMLIIKKEYEWYWCGKCGRFLNGCNLFDPGVEWKEPSLLADMRKLIIGLYKNEVMGTFKDGLLEMEIKDYNMAYNNALDEVLKKISEYLKNE